MSDSQPPQHLISTLSSGDAAASTDADADAVDIGRRIGRYVVLSRLGAGGMGVVYAAFDPELDRKVAIKLLHPRRSGSSGGVGDDDAKARLQREAQAMAQLSHPNVIAVYDVGTLGDQVFFAMEFVDGRTVRDWQDERRRSWREVLDVYLAAGRGLAAAHEAGLHHRDFKPDNMLIGKDGRVRVLDFGLARAGDEEEGAARTKTGAVRALEASEPDASAEEGSEVPEQTTRLLSAQLTEDGAVLGTPAYMAPEQHLGARTDARTDQFSFCVALYEALYGERPFAGRTRPQLALAVLDGKLRPESKTANVPGWLRRVVVRGLATEADARWPDMKTLLGALERDPSRRRNTLVLAGVTAAVLVGGGYGVFVAQDAGDPCAPTSDPLEGVWDAPRKEAARQAFLGTAVAYAPDVWASVSSSLDAYTDEFVEQKREACTAAVVRREQTVDLMQRRYQCLGRRLKEVSALSDLLVRADKEVVANAARAVSSLTPLSYCADTEALLTSLDPPLEGELAEQVKSIDADLARVKALRALGRPKEARPLAESALERADASGHRPSQARARLELGILQRDAGEPEQARESLLAAARMAERAHDDRLAARTLATVVYVVGNLLSRTEEAMEWADYADASLERIGDDPLVRGDLESGLGSVYFKAGQMKEARGHFEKALALRRSQSPPDPERVSASLNNLGGVAFTEEKWDEALAYFEEILALRREQLGEHHPELAGLDQNAGAVLARKLEFEPALVRFQRAAEIHAAAFGTRNHTYAAMLSNMGVVQQRLGRFERAERLQREALEIRTAIYGPDHDMVAASHLNLGSVLSSSGRDEAALAEFERAVAIYREVLGLEHPRLAGALASEADTLARLKRYEEARARLEEAHRIRMAAHGPDDARTSTAEAKLVGLQLETKPTAPAVERMRGLIEKLGGKPDELGALRWQLGQGLWATGEREAALEQVRRAVGELEHAHDHRGLADAKAWVAAHG